MKTCHRCKKPTAEFPVNLYGKTSTMCQRCYTDTMWRNAKRLARTKQERASTPDGERYCMRCRKSRPLDDFKISPKRKREIACGETHTKICLECLVYQSESSKKRRDRWDEETKKKYLENRSAYAHSFRPKLIEKYGGFCGETEPRFLQVDHIDGNGGQHRRQIGDTAEALWRWAQRHGFPPTLQVLCANCHNAKSFHGGCPHQAFNVLHLVEKTA